MRKYELKINDKPFSVHVVEFSAEEAQLEVNGQSYRVAIDKISEELGASGEAPPVRSFSSSAPVTAPAYVGATPGSDDAGSVRAPSASAAGVNARPATVSAASTTNEAASHSPGVATSRRDGVGTPSSGGAPGRRGRALKGGTA